MTVSGTQMKKENEDVIQSDNPIESLSHDQKIQFTTSRYFGDLKPVRQNATHEVRSGEFDIPNRNLNMESSGR